jgi:predicted nuclease of restriction endonuclease-like (RecB) superfamily
VKATKKIKTIRTHFPAKHRDYATLLVDIKQRIRAAQMRATFSANAELVQLYWDIGRTIDHEQQQRGWGTAVIPRLARDLRRQFPEIKGFSERNISRMIAFFRAYPAPSILPQPVAKLTARTKKQPSSAALSILPQAVAKLGNADSSPFDRQLLTQIPWGHHILLMERIKDASTRFWYMRQTVANGWSRNMLAVQISGSVHLRQGHAVTNFDQLLPPAQSDLAHQSLKDPYIFDFLTLEAPFHERELESQLLAHIQKFLLELGQGFAFVGRQFHLRVGGEDFYIDLLFYHLRLRCFFAIDLKTGSFEAEYAGKMNFYCNVIDDQLRHPADQPTIGLILCQDKNRLIAEYSLKGVNKAIGISGYQLTRDLPRQFQSSLPSIDEIETELSAGNKSKRPAKKTRLKCSKTRIRKF